MWITAPVVVNTVMLNAVSNNTSTEVLYYRNLCILKCIIVLFKEKETEQLTRKLCDLFLNSPNNAPLLCL